MWIKDLKEKKPEKKMNAEESVSVVFAEIIWKGDPITEIVEEFI